MLKNYHCTKKEVVHLRFFHQICITEEIFNGKLNFLQCVLKEVNSLQEFQDSLKKVTVQVLLSHVCFIINYSTNVLPSHHCTYSCFAFAAMFLHAKITLFPLRMRRTLFTSLKHVNECKRSFWPAFLGWCSYMKKNHPGQTGFFICKSEVLVLKNIPSSRDGI